MERRDEEEVGEGGACLAPLAAAPRRESSEPAELEDFALTSAAGLRAAMSYGSDQSHWPGFSGISSGAEAGAVEEGGGGVTVATSPLMPAISTANL